MSKNKFLDLIKEQRNQKTKEKFKGSFLEYLSLIEDNPEFCDLSHRRLYKSIVEQGSNRIEESDPRYTSFFEKEVYTGIIVFATIK